MTRILLVEDNAMNRDVLTRVLVRQGYEVLSAETGLEAVAAAERDRPDLIIMDISLPEMDGHEATRNIRAHPELVSTPIVALTAHALPEDRDAALKAGCDAFATKPVDIPRFLETLAGLLDGR